MSLHADPWDRIYDCAIVGTGLSALAAAHTAAARGWSCVVIGSDGDLAWECGRGLMAIDGNADGGPWWRAWCAWQQQRGTPLGDSAQGELAAHALLAAEARCTWLGYAPVVGIESHDGLLAAGIVACRQGLRRMRARRWLDASDGGIVASLLGAQPPRATRWEQRWMLVHGAWPESMPPVVLGEDVSAAWQPSGWSDARVLSVLGADPHALALAIPNTLAVLRAALATCAVACNVGVISPRCVPRYLSEDAAAVTPPSLARNLAFAVPGWMLGDDAASRCLAGEAAIATLVTAPQAEVWADHAPEPTPPSRTTTCDVLVVGLGTAGAQAALAAAEHGASVLACDPAWLPGGIGTAGLIRAYCAGADGGRAQAIDRAAVALPFHADGSGGNATAWHPQAKASALSSALAAAGANWLPGTAAYAVQRDGARVTAVDLATPDGPMRVHVRALIDASGDGSACRLAGARAHGGSRLDSGVLAFTQSAWMVREASSPQPATATVDASHLRHLGGTNSDCGWVDADDSVDLSRARRHGVLRFAQPVPQPGSMRPLLLAPTLGLRQSVHVDCDQMVSVDDLIAHRRWPDSIGPCASFFDTHASDLYLEDDAVVVWLLICRAFRARLGGDLPYRMLLPQGLDNVWIACRAAGMNPAAAYALRMQRDMQRLGEAAGIAAALAGAGDSRCVDRAELQRRLQASGALPVTTEPAPVADDPLQALDAGLDVAALWPLFAEGHHRAALLQRLDRPDRSGWLAAALLAANGESAAEPRLLAAIAARTLGPEPDHGQRGAFGQRIVVPDWVLALILLRRCGSAACVPVLTELAAGDPPFDLRCVLLATVLGLVSRLDAAAAAELVKLADHLVAVTPEAARLPPSRSVWRRILGEDDPPLHNDLHPVREDLRWQLQLLHARIRLTVGLPVDLAPLLTDARGQVRKAARQLTPEGVGTRAQAVPC